MKFKSEVYIPDGSWTEVDCDMYVRVREVMLGLVWTIIHATYCASAIIPFDLQVNEYHWPDPVR